MRAYAGFNEPDILIRNVLFDEKITDVNYETGIVMMRYLNELFVGESDLKKLNEEGYISKCGFQKTSLRFSRMFSKIWQPLNICRKD